MKKDRTYEEMYGKKRAEEIKQKLKILHQGKKHSEEAKEKMSLAKKEHWKSLEYATKIMKGLLKKPTSYEKKISELCIENSLPFIYTGNGTFLIGTKNPDFLNKEQKITIEVYSTYWKIKDYGSCENYEKQRSEYFAKYGYKVIFIRESEIIDENWKDICLKSIRRGLKEEKNEE
ncbi:MAG: NUMOD3 domain-containing DNA-binding protein [Patescibacteria group bacterium]